MLLLASILGSGTIFLMIIGALKITTQAMTMTQSFMLNMVPILVFVIICYVCKSDIQVSSWTNAEIQGAESIKRCHITSIGNPIVEIRWSYDRLISTMGFPILVTWHLYIESGPRAPCCYCDLTLPQAIQPIAVQLLFKSCAVIGQEACVNIIS